jgi:putative membrane protein
MQHVPTVFALIALVIIEKKQPLDRLSYSLVIAFLLLHVLGARYLYSYVPYDDWSQMLFGVRISDRFGFERNHYDRLVHFCFGLLFVYPLWRFFEVALGLRGVWPSVLAFCVILAASALYEIAEWATAMSFAPDWAEAYNGQQGDVWDAQRDMALATLGAGCGIAVVGLFKRQK